MSESGTGSYVNGNLDELRILKGRALTPEEIKAAASEGLTPSILRRWWTPR